MEGCFQGVLTALITPFKDGLFDENAYRQLIEWQIEQGIQGVVPCGTTGEASSLTDDEYKQVVQSCIEQVNGRVPVLVGSGSNNTAKAIGFTKFAKGAGADGVLQVTPYYNKPTQEGLYQHFKIIGKAVAIPIVLYNVPGRTGCNLLPETVARIAHSVHNVVGIKEATGNLTQLSEIIEFCPNGFQVLSGDDFTVLPSLAVGGCGVISVVSNIMPEKMVQLCKAALNADMEKAQKIHYELSALNRYMFIETNPIPVKTALALMGKVMLEFRMPMTELSMMNLDKLQTVLKSFRLI